MKKTKAIISCLLALVLILVQVPVLALAAAPKTDKDVTVHYVEDHFQKKGDDAWTFHYSDSYFSGSAYDYSHPLAKMSLGLALASASSREARNAKDYNTENRNFVSLMKDCGFTDPQSNKWMRSVPSNDSIGVNVAAKKLKDSTLLAVGIRGDLYRSEWGGNLELGPEGMHQNWDKTSDQTLAFLKEYIAKHKIKGPVKVWMSGYSRAAATANLAGGKLDDGFSLGKDVTLQPKDTYVYTFESPMGAQKAYASKPLYNNIQNMVSENDIVAAVPPTQMGFCRYGVDRFLPDKQDAGDEMAAAFRSKLKEVPNELFNLYIPDAYQSFGSKYDSPKELYPALGEALTTSFVTSRQDYVDHVQKYLMDIATAYYSTGDKDLSTSRAFQGFAKKVQDNGNEVFKSLLSPTSNPADPLLSYLVDSFKEEGYIDYDLPQLKAMVDELTPRLAKMAKDYPEVTRTTILNLLPCIAAHDVAPNLVMMEVLPDNYFSSVH